MKKSIIAGFSPASVVMFSALAILPNEGVATLNRGIVKALEATVQVGITGSNGSGVFVSNDGYLLTAKHVLVGETGDLVNPGQVKIRHPLADTTEFVYVSENSDYALLKIKAKRTEQGIGNFKCASVSSNTALSGEPIWILGVSEDSGKLAPLANAGNILNIRFDQMESLDGATEESLLEEQKAAVAYVRRLDEQGELLIVSGTSDNGMSGGPMVNRFGEVIAINSFNNAPADQAVTKEATQTVGMRVEKLLRRLPQSVHFNCP